MVSRPRSPGGLGGFGPVLSARSGGWWAFVSLSWGNRKGQIITYVDNGDMPIKLLGNAFRLDGCRVCVDNGCRVSAGAFHESA